MVGYGSRKAEFGDYQNVELALSYQPRKSRAKKTKEEESTQEKVLASEAMYHVRNPTDKKVQQAITKFLNELNIKETPKRSKRMLTASTSEAVQKRRRLLTKKESRRASFQSVMRKPPPLNPKGLGSHNPRYNPKKGPVDNPVPDDVQARYRNKDYVERQDYKAGSSFPSSDECVELTVGDKLRNNDGREVTCVDFEKTAIKIGIGSLASLKEQDFVLDRWCKVDGDRLEDIPSIDHVICVRDHEKTMGAIRKLSRSPTISAKIKRAKQDLVSSIHRESGLYMEPTPTAGYVYHPSHTATGKFALRMSMLPPIQRRCTPFLAGDNSVFQAPHVCFLCGEEILKQHDYAEPRLGSDLTNGSIDLISEIELECSSFKYDFDLTPPKDNVVGLNLAHRIRSHCSKDGHPPIHFVESFTFLAPNDGSGYTEKTYAQELLFKVYKERSLSIRLFNHAKASSDVELKESLAHLLGFAEGRHLAVGRDVLMKKKPFASMKDQSLHSSRGKVVTEIMNSVTRLLQVIRDSFMVFDWVVFIDLMGGAAAAWNAVNLFFVRGLFFDSEFPPLSPSLIQQNCDDEDVLVRVRKVFEEKEREKAGH